MNQLSIARLAVALGFLIGLPGDLACAWEPIRAHPQNPYILEFRGHPTVLRTYADSFSAVIDSAIPDAPYLNVLQRDGMNVTRNWCMGFRPDIATTPADFQQPWPRSTINGNALDGLGKWDFSTWNEVFFERLKAFTQAASDRGIVVEFTLFSVFYTDTNWQEGPFHPSNNVQGYGPNNWNDSLRPIDANLLAAQLAAVRRIVRELNGFDNVYYEIMNEPFWNEPGVKDDQDVAFHNMMLEAIRNEESGLPNRHLVAHNFPQNLASISADFDMINEHYPAAVPTTTVAGAEALLNNHYFRGRILSLDETDTETALQTRLEAWMFLIGGGGVYDALDANLAVYSPMDRSGDNALGNAMRGAVRNCGTYMDQLHLVALRRNLAWVTGGIPTGATLQACASPDQQYVAYLHHGRGGIQDFQLRYDPIDETDHNASLRVTLGAGSWRAVWTRPSDLGQLHAQEFAHIGGEITLEEVTYQADVALRIDRIGPEDLTPPSRPTGLGAASNADGSITLSWSPNQGFDLAGYHVYRAEAPGVPIDAAHRIGDLQAGTTSFTDQTASINTTYYYVVTAVDQAQNESTASPEVSTTSILVYPTLYIFRNDANQLTLKWTTSLPGWHLLESPNLNPGSWTDSTLIPSVVGDFYQVSFTPTDPRRFFRLVFRSIPPSSQLRIQTNGDGQFVLGWAATPYGWHLQESPDLTSGSWTNSSITPTVVGDQFQITITPTYQRRYFRLAYP